MKRRLQAEDSLLLRAATPKAESAEPGGFRLAATAAAPDLFHTISLIRGGLFRRGSVPRSSVAGRPGVGALKVAQRFTSEHDGSERWFPKRSLSQRLLAGDSRSGLLLPNILPVSKKSTSGAQESQPNDMLYVVAAQTFFFEPRFFRSQRGSNNLTNFVLVAARSPRRTRFPSGHAHRSFKLSDHPAASPASEALSKRQTGHCASSRRSSA